MGRLEGGETRARLARGTWARSGRQPGRRRRGPFGRYVPPAVPALLPLLTGVVKWSCVFVLPHPVVTGRSCPVLVLSELGVSGHLLGVRASISLSKLRGWGTDPACVPLELMVGQRKAACKYEAWEKVGGAGRWKPPGALG